MENNLRKQYEKVLRGDSQSEYISEGKLYDLVLERNFELMARLADTESKPESIGIVSQDQYQSVKDRVNSMAVVPKLASFYESDKNRWKDLTNYKEALLDKSSLLFSQNGLDAKFVDQLLAARPKLQAFDSAVSKPGKFSLAEVVVNDVVARVKGYAKESINTVFRSMVGIKGFIKQVGVGGGEIALTLFADARKGTTGDLDLNKDGRAIEVKTNGGRIGYAERAVNIAVDKMTDFITTNNLTDFMDQQVRADREVILLNLRGEIDKSFPAITGNGNLHRLLKSYLGDPFNITREKVDRDGFKVTASGKASEQRKIMLEHGYCEDPTGRNGAVTRLYALIRSKMDEVLTCKSVSQIKKDSYVVACRSIFERKLHVAPEVLADLLIEARPVDINLSKYKTNITEVIAAHGGSLDSFYRAAMFALTAICYYSHKRFNTLLVLNETSCNAASFVMKDSPEMFQDLVEQYQALAPQGVVFSVQADTQQGAGSVTVS